ncbi:o-succinylbenzoate synthase [Membranihabitans marinus]|uniref:o-succinylbenzoate synthase n=1 Tax=Membranihabitans marinus TaxID=1227546 RepID=UPI001F171323|nr:o-succinylbenzoate synthase [Membranihabitans marinus]
MDKDIKVKIIPHQLIFKFPAGTSRSVLHQRKTYFMILTSSDEEDQRCGWGEAGPLDGLSIEDDSFHQWMSSQTEKQALASVIDEFQKYPSTRFALESALLDWENGGRRIWYDGEFARGNQSIAINGLIWMGTKQEMYDRIKSKLELGNRCLKLKIGGIDFAQELDLLKYIRQSFSVEDLELRLDANGSFAPDQAEERLKQLSVFGIHSIEQPIKAGQSEIMAQLCSKNIIPIALDEELIGWRSNKEKKDLVEAIKPQYLIFKPSLIGGIEETAAYIDLCNKNNIGWWMTSALESNVGLNVLAQLSDHWSVTLPQGLGTGQLFTNNIDSPLQENGGQIFCNPERTWGELPG